LCLSLQYYNYLFKQNKKKTTTKEEEEEEEKAGCWHSRFITPGHHSSFNQPNQTKPNRLERGLRS